VDKAQASSTLSKVVDDAQQNGDVDKDYPLRHVVTHSTVNQVSKDDEIKGVALSPSSPSEVHRAVIHALFDVASSENTRDPNRRKIYAICKGAKDDIADEDDA
jgi:hypothetical protein